MSLNSDYISGDFETRKEFMDFLGDLMTASYEKEPKEILGEGRGRPRLLKSYLMEVNGSLPRNIKTSLLQISSKATKLSDIDILYLNFGNMKAQFYVDSSDKRFWILHTNDLADHANFLFKRLVFSPNANIDMAWLPFEILQKIAVLPENSFRGFGLRYQDFFAFQDEEGPVEELRMRVYGSSSMDALEALKDKAKLRRSLSYSMVRVRRGDFDSFVTGELGYDSRFIAKAGSSIDDYVSLIEITRKIYRSTIEAVEKSSIGVKDVEGRTLVTGNAFDITLEREIEDLGFFVDQLVSSDSPFRLWGMTNRVTSELIQVIAIDLHTGDPIDIEVSPHLIRVYLHDGACGNTVLRLYTNLQHFFDSATKLGGEKLSLDA